MIETIGFIAALLIGVVLGLLGGGGSILTVPVLVYILGISPVLSTAYSLFVVGSSALVGTVTNLRKGLVSLKTAVVFAVPSFIAVYLTRRFVVPTLPEELFSINDFVVTKDIGIMLFFAVLMLVAAISMIRSKKDEEEDSVEGLRFNYPLIALEGLVVGTLTGFVGAGGGFLIIPTLVLLTRLPMKLAVGTSLFIVSIKSLIGFLGDVQTGQVIDWHFLLLFTSFSVIGIFIGMYLSNFIAGKWLKKGFGYFVLAMAFFVLTKELLL